MHASSTASRSALPLTLCGSAADATVLPRAAPAAAAAGSGGSSSGGRKWLATDLSASAGHTLNQSMVLQLTSEGNLLGRGGTVQTDNRRMRVSVQGPRQQQQHLMHAFMHVLITRCARCPLLTCAAAP